jgi:recombination protein RecA
MAKKKRVTPDELTVQMKQRLSEPPVKREEYDGDFVHHVSTGSTLLDLAIAGGRVRGGGLPGGILVEAFGPSGSGKTVVLCQIAGAVQRQGGSIFFRDPEARLNRQFATMFDLDVEEMELDHPDTIPEVFEPIRKWEPEPEEALHGVFVDSLAALSTNLELDSKDGDKMGMRRAKEFSEQLRKTCRTIAEKKFLVVCSNQVRSTGETSPYAEKTSAAGGYAIGFYASTRLRFGRPRKIKATRTINKKEIERIIGVTTEVEVYKNSVWKPYRTAPLTIIFDYGIDNIRENLQYLKRLKGTTVFMLGETKLDRSLDKSIAMIEENGLEKELEEAVIDLWEEVESKFDSNRKRRRF